MEGGDGHRNACARTLPLGALFVVADGVPGPAVPLDGKEVLCDLADLPVAVGEAGAEGGLRSRVVEGGKCSGGPSAYRRLVVKGRDDRIESGGVPDGAQGGDGRLAAERIAVSGEPIGERDERGYGDRLGALTQCPRRHLDDHGGAVRQGPVECDAGPGGSQLRGPSSDGGLGVSEGLGHDTVVERAQAVERTECGFAHCWAGVRHSPAGRHPVAHVPRHHDGPAPFGDLVIERSFGDLVIERSFGDLVIERFRGRLLPHRLAGPASAVTGRRPFRSGSVFGARSRHRITMTER